MNSLSTSLPGILYVVATPIGHREDVSLRALSVLQAVDFILAEDTRHSSPLLLAWGIKKPLQALHDHNELKISERIIQRLLKGESAALISDAGTPLICDPGYSLVKLARSQGITVTPIPGACALTAALSASGIPCEVFTFVGFLPAKQTARRRRFMELAKVSHTVVLYESTHRILACLEDLAHVYGEACEIVLVKELTKTFERFISGAVSVVKTWLCAESAHEKGEFVVIIPARDVCQDVAEALRFVAVLHKELPLKQAVKLAAELTSVGKNELYARSLSQQELDKS